MARINSKAKGKVGELELSRFLTEHGYPARRGQQFKGGPGSADVEVEGLPFHLECKRTERFNLYAAMEQAQRDCGEGKTPLVCHRRNRSEWFAVLRLEDLLNLFLWSV